MNDANPLDLYGQSLLVVEDDAMVGQGLVSYLESLRAQVIWVSNVEDALTAIGGTETIDVAIVDLNLDGHTSAPVIDCLQAAGIYAILCTGYDTESIEPRFRLLPRSQKPFTRLKIRQLLIARP